MNNILLNKEDIRELSVDPDVDNFLDNTDLFDQWEAVLPDAEYPIFIMAVLNNIRSDVIIETILNSVLDNAVTPDRSVSAKDTGSVKNNDHPFS